MSFNHVIDPTFFYDALNEFSFNYDAYIQTGMTVDDYGKQIATYEQKTITGSIQSQGTSLQQAKKGNTNSTTYNFYCKSLFRIAIGDFIHYQDKWLYVTSVNDYDEWGVRSCVLEMTDLMSHKDLADYVAYINGGKIV